MIVRKSYVSCSACLILKKKNGLEQCTPVCMARSTCDRSYFCPESHLDRNNSEAPLSPSRSDSRTQNSSVKGEGSLCSVGCMTKDNFVEMVVMRLWGQLLWQWEFEGVCSCVCLVWTMSVLWWCDGESQSNKLHEAPHFYAEQACLIAFTLPHVIRLDYFFLFDK